MAIRLATKGNGTNLYGTIPVWIPGASWEVEFDAIFPTTAPTVQDTYFDSDTASNRLQLTQAANITVITWVLASAVYIDGVAATTGVTLVPTDGAVHRIRMVGTAAARLGVIYARYQFNQPTRGTIFNLSLKDLSNPSNSRFYPMSESIVTDNFADTLSGAQHGTWFNRTAGNIIEVTVPSADRSLISRSLITRSLISRSLISRSL